MLIEKHSQWAFPLVSCIEANCSKESAMPHLTLSKRMKGHKVNVEKHLRYRRHSSHISFVWIACIDIQDAGNLLANPCRSCKYLGMDEWSDIIKQRRATVSPYTWRSPLLNNPNDCSTFLLPLVAYRWILSAEPQPLYVEPWLGVYGLSVILGQELVRFCSSEKIIELWFFIFWRYFRGSLPVTARAVWDQLVEVKTHLSASFQESERARPRRQAGGVQRTLQSRGVFSQMFFHVSQMSFHMFSCSSFHSCLPRHSWVLCQTLHCRSMSSLQWPCVTSWVHFSLEQF